MCRKKTFLLVPQEDMSSCVTRRSSGVTGRYFFLCSHEDISSCVTRRKSPLWRKTILLCQKKSFLLWHKKTSLLRRKKKLLLAPQEGISSCGAGRNVILCHKIKILVMAQEDTLVTSCLEPPKRAS